MLGWFKKKLKNKDTAAPDAEPAGENASAVTESPESVQADRGGEEPAPDLMPETTTVFASPEESAPAARPEEEIEVIGCATDEQQEPGQEEAGKVGETPPAKEPAGKRSLFSRLQNRLDKTRKSFVYRLDTLFLGKKEIDQELFDDLEEILITADMGVLTTQDLLDEVRIEVKRRDLKDPQVLKAVLKEKILGYLTECDRPAELVMPDSGPFVIMVVGVNGVGKTTSIGKIAAKFVGAGKSVLLVAGDTFRAAAIDQLKIWARRCNVEIIAQKQGSDPSSVVYDALEYGTARDFEVIIVDTAGRLHTQVNLMEELKKIKRVMGKKLPGAPHEVMLVLDATTGQNGISQAKLFNEAVEISGLTLTKLDGTARGGIIVNICREMNIPVRFIGIGEQIDDLRDFSPREFVDALFGEAARGGKT